MRLKCFIAILTICSSVILYGQDLAGWNYVGPKENPEQIKGMIKSLWMDAANPNFLLAGSGCGGLFKTENALSQTPEWICITDTYDGMTFGVSDIIVKPNTNNQVIYISTGHKNALSFAYGNGILKTNDGGKTWKRIGPGVEIEYTFALDGLVVNKENDNEMIAYSAHEIFLTKNDWQTFETIDVPIDKNNRDLSIADVEFAPFEPGKFYACTRTNNVYEAKVFKCENYGKQVIDITPKDIKSERAEIATIFDKKYKGKFYLASGWTNCYLKYYNGKNFSENLNAQAITQTHSGAYWNFELAVNQTDTNIIYLSMTETARSLDGGKTFSKISFYNSHNTHADNRAMILAKSTFKGEKDILILGNDGGVSLTNEFAPVNWKNLNGKGLDVNMFWGVAVLQSDSLLVTGGAHDNGGFIITSTKTVNTIYSCGDGYVAGVLDENSLVIECNAPSAYYHNLKTAQSIYLQIGDDRFDGKRPLVIHDSFVYIGHANIWRASKQQLERGNGSFTKYSNIPEFKNSKGYTQNSTVKSLAIGELNSAVVAFRDPNWGDGYNTGKLFFCKDIERNQWLDITNDAICNGFPVCQWHEITECEMDPHNANKFYIVSKDVFNQTNSRLFEMEYLNDSNKCKIKEIGTGIAKVGMNKIRIDKFSDMIYLACDNGIYYGNLNSDALTWNKFNTTANKLPNVMVFDLSINYATNTLYAATFGRGFWRCVLAGNANNVIEINKNTIENKTVKVDGKLIVSKKRSYTFNSKLILTTGSKIEIKKGGILIIKNKDLVRDENNKVVDINNYLTKDRTAKVIIGVR